MDNEYDILIWVLAEKNEQGFFSFNSDSVLINSLHENYFLSLQPILFDLILESVSELDTPKNDVGHEIKLKHIIKSGGWGQPNEEYFEPIEIKEIAWTCAVCDKEISSEDFINSSVCSQYCAEVLNGTPMPYSQSAHIFDIIHNGS